MIEVLPNWHPVLVHFAIAPIALAVLGFILAPVMAPGEMRTQLLIVARWNFFIGAAAALLTVLAGWYAYNTVLHDDPSHAAMLVHRNWAMATIVAIVLLAFRLWWGGRLGRPTSKLFLGGLAISLLLLLATAWHGGELVYRYGLGVLSLPATEERGHDHGDTHAHDQPSAAPQQQSGGEARAISMSYQMAPEQDLPLAADHGHESGAADTHFHDAEPEEEKRADHEHGHGDDHSH